MGVSVVWTGTRRESRGREESLMSGLRDWGLGEAGTRTLEVPFGWYLLCLRRFLAR